MTYFKITNPPAAAAAAIFVSPLAQRQPEYGIFYLVAPGLLGCAWALLVQCALAKTVKYMKARGRRQKPPIVWWRRSTAVGAASRRCTRRRRSPTTVAADLRGCHRGRGVRRRPAAVRDRHASPRQR